MIKTIDMKVMRYINLFAKVSRVSPKHCLNYNNAVIFVVPGSKVSEAIGDNGKNIKKMSEIIGKKVKVVMEPKDISDAEKFISTIIYPVEMNGVEVDLISSGLLRFDSASKGEVNNCFPDTVSEFSISGQLNVNGAN